MRRPSRYLATVRRAQSIPCSLSISESCWSLSGLRALSAAINCLINARTAVLDAWPPESVPSPEPKKYLSSKVPNDVGLLFGRGDPADGGLMQAQLIGNLAQHQGTHRQLAMAKEIFLVFDDRTAHPQNGIKTLLD